MRAKLPSPRIAAMPGVEFARAPDEGRDDGEPLMQTQGRAHVDGSGSIVT